MSKASCTIVFLAFPLVFELLLSAVVSRVDVEASLLQTDALRVQVYVWGRRHPYVHLNFLGLFNFTAPYLPWVLLAFSVTLRSNAVVDLLGIVAGIPPFLAIVSVLCKPTPKGA